VVSFCSELAQVIESIVLYESLVVASPVCFRSQILLRDSLQNNAELKGVIKFEGADQNTVDFIMKTTKSKQLRNILKEEDSYNNQLFAGFYLWVLLAHNGLALLLMQDDLDSLKSMTKWLYEDFSQTKIEIKGTGNSYKGFADKILNQVTNTAQERINVLDIAHGREDILKVALDVRNSREAQAFRKQLAFFDEATMVGDDKSLVPIIEEMRDKIDILGKKLAQPRIGLDIAFPWGVAVEPLSIWESIKFKRKRHLIFIEDLYNSAIRARSINIQLSKLTLP